MVMPEILGVATIKSTRVERRKTYNVQKTENFWISTGDVTKYHCDEKSYNPPAGYFIDMDTLKDVKNKTQGHYNNRFLKKSSSGFTYKACAKSKVSVGWRGPKKKNGIIDVTVIWKEFREEDIRSDNTDINTTIKFNKDFEKLFDRNTDTISIEIAMFNGRQVIFTDNHRDQFFDINWNAGTKQLVIKPLGIDDIKKLHTF